ncbi:hypothetical protein TUM20983_43380 [Mycobacterium antarcticum]|uniref:hypothetical protein n=1 Tax=unclassified Mycolicibacterium TaxID=2636767 RepID=UPI00239A031C|nr:MULTISPECIES: hypothetical protein [unclassified Mycolicibacterium]GLP77228.1 hypothetical protein TUM20983_43380 [Mycolicibacterium sp. TUM20983]GLP82356.1 hypothetical protein TUM20984_37760 [Mycolicibacterium sp. TUM20984]
MSSLDEAAFGEDPGRWPLPAAGTAAELWLRAVAAGGQGRYGSAAADLESLGRTRPHRALASLAHSTRASFLRQLGGHREARAWDGLAWVAADSNLAAGADALIGLAADALGLGRFALARRLLLRAEGLLALDAPTRLAVRLSWVHAELAMFTGEGTAAVGHAESAVDSAQRSGSARHRTKSQVVLSAALCSAGDVDASRRVADAALRDAERLGLIPLSWASASLLADIGSAEYGPAEIAARRDGFAEVIRHRGGTWTAR